MNITRVVVKGLFGIFDHDIPINTDEKITIIHGPNGFGKTAFLKIVHNVFCGNFEELRKMYFDKIDIMFNDQSSLYIQRLITGSFIKLKVSLSKYGQDEFDFEPIFKSPHSAVRPLSTLNSTKFTESYIRNYEDKYFSVVGSLQSYFIETQRLLHLLPLTQNDTHSISPVVELYSRSIVNLIGSKLADSTALVQSLDRTLPVRLVEQDRSALTISTEDLKSKINSLEAKRSRLVDAGLLDKDNNDINLDVFNKQDISESTQSVLTIYLQDMEKKLGFFDEILEKIELMKKVINKRFLYKKMIVSKEKGFLFTTSGGKALLPSDLSSGEQHELVLLYDLLFNMESGSLILIDEPELSLHVAWQMEFLRDLQDIIAITDSTFVIATHSPQIINDRWDLTVELKGPNS